MAILVIANQKGGVGKTTSAVNLGAGLARQGRRVLLVDCDPQANTTKHLGFPAGESGLAGVLVEGMDLLDVRITTPWEGLDLIPSNRALAGATVHLADEPGRDQILSLALKPVAGEYGYILLDCPPSLGLLTVNSLAAGQWLLVPLQLEFFGVDALAELERTLEVVRQRLNPTLRLGGIFPCRYQHRRLAQEVLDLVKKRYGDLLFRTIIRENIRLAEASSHGQPIFTYDPQCHGAEDYAALTEEVIQRVEEEKTGSGA